MPDPTPEQRQANHARAWQEHDRAELAWYGALERYHAHRTRLARLLGDDLGASTTRLGARAARAAWGHRHLGELGEQLMRARAALEAAKASVRSTRRALRTQRPRGPSP